MPTAAPFLELHQANVWRGETLALNNLSLKIELGEKVAILGPNGAGKSSLLKLLTGEVRAEHSKNSVCKLFGDDLWAIDELRERLGIVMPEEVARFDDDELGADVVLSGFRGAYGRDRSMRFSASEKQRAEKAMALLGVIHLAQRSFAALSSGEKRRFLIARACAMSPQVLVLDEPTTALDFPGSLSLLRYLSEMANERGTLVMVTHHPGEILPQMERVILLKQGSVFRDGDKKKVLTSANLSELFEMPCAVKWSGGWCEVVPG